MLRDRSGGGGGEGGGGGGAYEPWSTHTPVDVSWVVVAACYCLPVCLHACVLACMCKGSSSPGGCGLDSGGRLLLPACLRMCVRMVVCVCARACTCMCACCLPACLPVFLPACLCACLPDGWLTKCCLVGWIRL